ncbi:MAG: MarR family transcriptional regulator [Halobacteriales archaeon]|nr:MarR family transcriptional regulator [Halobacteriales archaeon]
MEPSGPAPADPLPRSVAYDPSTATIPDLEPRAVAVLRELAREGESQVAFQGLRRRLDLHQEALQRTLRRLARDGLVLRSDTGYTLTEQGHAALRGVSLTEPRRETLTVVQAVLPPHLAAEQATERLSRRWFRGLRWYGVSHAPNEVTLTWLTEPGNSKVRARIAGSTLTLEVEVGPGEPGKAFGAARAVLAALAELYGMPGDDASSAGAFTASNGFAA